jgi:hypothetical protein
MHSSPTRFAATVAQHLYFTLTHENFAKRACEPALSAVAHPAASPRAHLVGASGRALLACKLSNVYKGSSVCPMHTLQARGSLPWAVRQHLLAPALPGLHAVFACLAHHTVCATRAL